MFNQIKKVIPDSIILKYWFRKTFGYKLDLKHPKTFNEKLQWLKIYNRNPQYTDLVDKIKVKDYVKNIIGEQYLIKTLGVWNKFDDISFDSLPNKFVLKCNHDSGSVVICKDKSSFDMDTARKILTRALKENFYYRGREWPYKNVERKIFAEEYIDAKNGELTDYKFMCFDGKVKLIFTCTDRFSGDGLKVTFFDREWNKMPFERHYPSDRNDIPKPECLDTMIEFAERLSADIPTVRIDFYENNKNIYFGEITFFPGGGMEEFNPEEWDLEIGKWVVLPEKKRLK